MITRKTFKKSSTGFAAIILAVVVAAGCSSGTGSAPAPSKAASATNSPEFDSSITLKMLGCGETCGESIEKTYNKAFTEKTGIKIVGESPASLGKLEAMVKSGQKTYDLINLSNSGLFEEAVRKDLLEPLDWNQIKPDPILEGAKSPYGLGFQYITTMLAWNKKVPALASWADYWDVKKFPGKRSLRDYPNTALVMALLADGVPADQLYPLDLDRAFKKLKEIAPYISVWWTTGAQPVQLLNDGEVDYVDAYNGRIMGNPNIGYTYNQGLLDVAYFAVPKGVKSKGDNYMKAVSAYFHELTVSKNEADAAKIIPYTGPSTEFGYHFKPEELKIFPTDPENLKKQIQTNTAYWAENQKKVDAMWLEFKLSLKK